MPKTTPYNQTPVDVGDFEPPEDVGRKDTYWNKQVLELKDLSRKVHADLYNEDGTVKTDRTTENGTPLAPADVKKGWRFYPGAQSKAHDLPNKYPGIERRKAPHNGTDGLWMRYNPILNAQIKAAEATKSTEPATPATPAEPAAKTK